jgi:serine/threonine protein kinase
MPYLIECGTGGSLRSRPYRAPELLFGPRTYNAFAIDSWSLGATFAEFFTSVRLYNPLDDEDFGFGLREDEQSDSGDESPPAKPAEPFIIPKRLRIGDPSNRWARDSLFDSTRGEIGLAWSIFKTRGSPNETNWPVSVISLLTAIVLSDTEQVIPEFAGRKEAVLYRSATCRPSVYPAQSSFHAAD